MRTATAVSLLAALLLTGAAVAKPDDTGRPEQDKSIRNTGSPPPAGATRTGGHTATPGQVGAQGTRGSHNDRGGKGDHMHRPDGRVWGGPFYPYPPAPTTWPYPPYPYSQYYYPYPPQYYPGPVDDDDDGAMPSTRGLVVPGDLPVGMTAYWYYCDAPDGYYPYVKSCSHEWTRIPISPPPPGTTAPVSYSEWQWCEERHAFFPYVTACPAGFVAVPVTAPGKDQAGPPQVANWYFCEDPKGYSPYVVQCGRDWRAVPAVPPPSVKVTVKDEKH